jgi:hypothetical protein
MRDGGERGRDRGGERHGGERHGGEGRIHHHGERFFVPGSGWYVCENPLDPRFYLYCLD